MSKRKPKIASKHSRSPKIAAKAQRASQAVVRSPKGRHLRSVEEAGSTESRPPRDNDTQQQARRVENPATEQQASVVENPATALPNAFKQTMTDVASNKGVDLYLATANVRAYQAKLLEMAQANMQFAFEFAQRLATIRSPLEFPSVIAELTSKRIAMFQKFSKEMAELITNRRTA
jgi:phasin protein